MTIKYFVYSILFTTVLLLSLSLNAYGLTSVNNTDFSINVLDNWAYKEQNLFIKFLASALGGGSSLTLVPTEFVAILVNNTKDLTGESIQNGGVYSNFGLDTNYEYRNVPLETYTQYNINLYPVKIFSKENTTIGGEKAIKVHRTPRTNETNIEVVDYYVMHGDKPYNLQYVANTKDYQKYLPQFEQMVKSFKFVK